MINLSKSGMLVLTFLLAFAGIGYGQSNIPTKEEQISAAVSPAPEKMQQQAKVLGYTKNGELVTLREGNNQLVCLADNPQQSNFHVACYHKDLEPFMKRGRELKARGMSRKKVDSLRREAIKSGEIPMPRKPMALYSLTGPVNSFNYATGQVMNASPLYVVYVPFETEASTGLAGKPTTKGAPWIMEPGTPWAHIMVITGRDIGKKSGSGEK